MLEETGNTVLCDERFEHDNIRTVHVVFLFVLLCINTALCEHTGKELPRDVTLITRKHLSSLLNVVE